MAYHFPELRLIMTHCGQPWTEEAIATIAHWDNVFMSCTSVAPQYWPDAFVRFINTRGREKMMFGTEFPTIPWERSREELDDPTLGRACDDLGRVGDSYAINLAQFC